MTDARNEGSADLLYGLAAIGEHLQMTDRQVEHLISKGELPTFKLGRAICARRSALASYFAKLEKKRSNGYLLEDGSLVLPATTEH